MEKFLPKECIDCVIKKRLNGYPKTATELQATLYKRKVLEFILNCDPQGGAPLITREITNLLKELFGVSHDFKDIKFRFNAAMLKEEEYLRNKVFSSADPLITALKYATAANYIDYSTVKNVNEKTLKRFLKKSEKIKFNEREIEALKKDITSSRRAVYITDNCGEILADKIVAEVIKTLNPNISLVAVCRGKEVLNDATKEDLMQVGFDKVCPIIPNGSDVAGIYFKETSPAALSAINSADFIISKGQGNFETLRGCGLNIYYLFLVKCEMFAKKFDSPLFTAILTNEKRQ